MARPTPARKPKPDGSQRLRTLAEIVTETGVSAGQIAMAARTGFVVATARSKYDRDQTLLGLIRYFQSRVGQLPIYDNDSQCSAATGIPVETIRQTRKKHKIGPNRDVGLGPLLKALFESEGDNSVETKSKYAALNEKMDYELKAGLIVHKSDVAHTIKRGLSGFFRTLDQRSNVDLPPVLAGLDAAEIQRELVKSDDELKNNLLRDWSELVRNGEAKNGELNKSSAWILASELQPEAWEWPIFAYFGNACDGCKGPCVMLSNWNETFTHWQSIPHQVLETIKCPEPPNK